MRWRGLQDAKRQALRGLFRVYGLDTGFHIYRYIDIYIGDIYIYIYIYTYIYTWLNKPYIGLKYCVGGPHDEDHVISGSALGSPYLGQLAYLADMCRCFHVYIQ